MRKSVSSIQEPEYNFHFQDNAKGSIFHLGSMAREQKGNNGSLFRTINLPQSVCIEDIIQKQLGYLSAAIGGDN